jgi:hypothetical protein
MPDELLKDEPHRNVTRTGGVVYREAGDWTPAVHALLQYLHNVGFAKVPRPIGIDEHGREMLEFIPGDSGADSWAKIIPDEGLAKFARLLREYHDAVRSFVAPPGVRWAINEPARATDDIICHGDFAPWNVVWQGDEPVAIIDWDFAGPGVAMDDVAYALEYAAPFRSDEEATRWLRYEDPPDRPHRIDVFAAAYGLDSTVGLVDRVIERQRLDASRVARLAALGREPQATWVANSYLDELAARVAWTERSRPMLER